jgi:hypothetical protein
MAILTQLGRPMENLLPLSESFYQRCTDIRPERASLPWSIRVVDLTTGQAKEIWKAQKGVGSNFFAGGLVADNHLFWTSDNMIIFPYEGDGWHHLYSVCAWRNSQITYARQRRSGICFSSK